MVMNMTKVFIVGGQGTTGLRLRDRLSLREDVELVEPEEAHRKDPAEIKRLLSISDFAFLCLPDDAARQTAELAADLNVRIIDASTAHRADEAWAYGFPELSPEHRRAVQNSRLVAAPGCHAGGAIALIYPLMSRGLLKKEAALSLTSLTGYSGGGKQMIAGFQDPGRGPEFESPKLYAMGQSHKHLPEITKQCGLETPPLFLPIVGDFYSGMLVSLPLSASMLTRELDAAALREIYREHYTGGGLVKVSQEEPSALWTNALSGRDDMEIFVSGSQGRLLACARFDNLGKGASGAAIQCFNIMRGLPEGEGLNVG